MRNIQVIYFFKKILTSLGNHEFDEEVSGLTPFIHNLSCPVLAANLILDKVPELQNEKNLYKSKIFIIENTLVGIIGYLTPETKFLASRNDVDFVDEIIALKKEVKVLQSQSVHIIIALGHSGYVKDLEIAKEVEGIDLVIGGHSNTFLWNGESPDSENSVGSYPIKVKQKSGRIVLVTQAYAYTKYLGKLYLHFNSTGEIVKCSGDPILLDSSIPQDPEVLNLINSYKRNITLISAEAVGYSDVILNGSDCRLRECNIGNFVTDAIVHYYNKNEHEGNFTQASIAILQGGRIRASIDHPRKPIPLTRFDWMTVFPFSGYIVIVAMPGSVLLQALEHAVSTWREIDSTGQFLQLSGINVVYDITRPPGLRVISAEARCAKCNVTIFNEINGDEQYNVMMPNFLYEGGDNFKMFDTLPMKKLYFDELASIYDYLKDHQTVAPKLTGRIKIINQAKSNSNTQSLVQHQVTTYILALFMMLIK